MLEYVVVNDRERAQIALLVQRCRSLAEAQLDANIQALYAKQSAASRLQSGSTITYGVNAMGDVVAQLVPELAGRVAAIVRDTAAFEAVEVATNGIIDAFHERLAGVVRMAEGRHRSQGSDSGVLRAAEKQFQDWRADVESQLAILAYDFEPDEAETVIVTQPVLAAPDKKGGRPLASFWDDMWASIASMLYAGSLHPKSQADVERAMADWIEAHGHSAADSTVRARARRLWDNITALDD